MQTHPIPEGRWEVIHADWITDLPRTEKGHNAILVIHDKVTKYAYFIPIQQAKTIQQKTQQIEYSHKCSAYTDCLAK